MIGSRARKVVIGRRLSTTTDAIAHYPHPVLSDMSKVFHKDSTSRVGGAKGADAPREVAVICLASLGLDFYSAKLALFVYDWFGIADACVEELGHGRRPV